MSVVAEASLLLKVKRDAGSASALDQVQRDVRQTGAAVEEMGRKTQSATAPNRALQTAAIGLRSSVGLAGTEVRKTTAQVAALGSTSGRARPEVKRLATDTAALGAGALRAAPQLRRMDGEVRRVGRSSRAMRATVGNLGQQIQDVAVQAQMGTAGLTIFAQQGPQIMGAFGPVGAVLGSVVAIGALVATAFFATKNEGTDLDAALSALSETTKRFKPAAEIAGASADELTKRYGRLGEAARASAISQLQAGSAIAANDARRIAKTFFEPFSGLSASAIANIGALNTAIAKVKITLHEANSSVKGFDDALSGTDENVHRLNEELSDLRAARSILIDMAINFGTSRGETEKLAASLANLRGQKTPEAIAAALRKVGAVLQQIQDGTSETTKEFDDFQTKVGDAEQQLIDTGVAIDLAVVLTNQLAAASKNVGFAKAIIESAIVGDNLARAVALAGQLGSAGTNALAEARIRNRFVGNPEGGAGALAALRFETGLDVAIENLPDGAADFVRDQKRRAINEARETARLNAATAKAQADLRKANRKKSGGGGKRKGAKERDVVGDINAEVAAIQRRLEADRQGAAAVRENMILEAQLQALKRAGLGIEDLRSGKNQARAQAIVRQSRALFDLQAAEKASTDITRAHAREIGQSYEASVEAIRDWRAKALADLEAVGTGHAGFAEKVEEVFKARLKKAYEDDLEQRKDWQAGLERGLNSVVASTGSLADAVEETVTASFGRMEDVVANFAKTGKVEIGDLADFAIRQAFRIAQAYALQSIGGGGGGSGGFGSAILSLLGLGGGAAASSSAFSFTSSATPGVLDTAFFLHSGGTKTDAQRRQMATAPFNNAPRLHGGGLKPGEFRAVLTDDERVLTDAQQTATAQSLMAMARIATASAGAQRSEAGQQIVLNVHGAPGGTEVRAQESGNGLSIDVLLEGMENRMGQRMAQGRGALSNAIERRYELSPRGVR